jgi:hypothetical protein
MKEERQMKRPRIKKIVTALAVVIFSGAIGTAALAQDWRGPHPLANTDHYLDRHPEVAAQLQQHPGLVDNSRYVASHPGLHEFLARHPVARTEWKSHPYHYMNRETKYDQNH